MAGTADELIRARATEQGVVTRTTGNDVVAVVAITGECTSADVGQALDVGRQDRAAGIEHRHANFIVAATGLFDDGGGVPHADVVDVIAGAPFQPYPCDDAVRTGGEHVIEGGAYDSFDSR
ncbi:hypothetical protein FQZ97_1007390 [compost metagenome]